VGEVDKLTPSIPLHKRDNYSPSFEGGVGEVEMRILLT